MSGRVATVPPGRVETPAEMVRAMQPALVVTEPGAAMLARPLGAGSHQLGEHGVLNAAFQVKRWTAAGGRIPPPSMMHSTPGKAECIILVTFMAFLLVILIYTL